LVNIIPSPGTAHDILYFFPFYDATFIITPVKNKLVGASPALQAVDTVRVVVFIGAAGHSQGI
jgi:hypothetical protein